MVDEEPLSQTHIDSLIEQGYRRVSNKFGHITRIDRVDWIDVLYDNSFGHRDAKALKAALKDYYAGRLIIGFIYDTIRFEAESAADDYRRCQSNDLIVLDPADARKIPTSLHDSTGYIPKI